jgi:hypothetical protein
MRLLPLFEKYIICTCFVTDDAARTHYTSSICWPMHTWWEKVMKQIATPRTISYHFLGFKFVFPSVWPWTTQHHSHRTHLRLDWLSFCRYLSYKITPTEVVHLFPHIFSSCEVATVQRRKVRGRHGWWLHHAVGTIRRCDLVCGRRQGN